MDKKYIWYTLAVVFGLWLFAVTSVKAQEAEVPMIRGTISFLFDDDTIESITSDNMFMTQGECYDAGSAAVQEFLPQLQGVIGHLIVCEPAGEDI